MMFNQNDKKIDPISTSKHPYYCWFVDSMHILSDQNTLISLYSKKLSFFVSQSFPIKENLSTNKCLLYIESKRKNISLYSLKVLEKLNTLLFESIMKKLVMYNLFTGEKKRILEVSVYNLQSMTVLDNRIYFYSNNEIFSVNLRNFECKQITSIDFRNRGVCCIRKIELASNCKKLAFVFNNKSSVIILDLNKEN